MITIAMGQEIDQQLNQPIVLASRFEMVRGPRPSFVAAKKVGSGEQPDVSHNVLATPPQNLR
ncbi:hypothetical protein GCM10010869_11010 [Mesorhizobium tianshanense]|uniref:Uncharacterized protein n=1 Tax=Mesorhizobium tianshanense TaxID=39844 RepID=A0A562MTC8_9HYPH|nr:hypothetical protein [Mesorhizobium tianshanense]TWI22841.1 hypothetical protein IQ26_06584 [Mesorhizobium tianshanense]GLS35513.1 hypothetical protein GCM10010869_11010 [Mesorhizobium tianshanense]